MTSVQITRKPDLVEKRKAERYDIHVTVNVTAIRILWLDGSKQVLETRNISSTGAFLNTARPLRCGARVVIDLILTFKQLQRLFGADRRLVINLKGRVVRVASDGMAIRFGRFYRMDMA